MKGIATIILTILYGQLIACVCTEKETVKKSFENYPLIFHGRVIEKSVVLYSTTLEEAQLKNIREKLKGDEKRLLGFENETLLKVTFEIIEIIKGDSIVSTVSIFTSHKTSCDINFIKNKDYLVYGTRQGFNNSKYLKHADNNVNFLKQGHYWTHFCTRTSPFNEKEKMELTELKNG